LQRRAISLKQMNFTRHQPYSINSTMSWHGLSFGALSLRS
jgi:hypothetical protein